MTMRKQGLGMTRASGLYERITGSDPPNCFNESFFIELSVMENADYETNIKIIRTHNTQVQFSSFPEV